MSKYDYYSKYYIFVFHYENLFLVKYHNIIIKRKSGLPYREEITLANNSGLLYIKVINNDECCKKLGVTSCDKRIFGEIIYFKISFFVE